MQYGAWDHWKKKVVKDSMWGKRIQKMNCGRENYQHERRVASNKGTSDVDNLWWYLPSPPWIQWWNHWLQSQCVCLNFGKHEWLKKKKNQLKYFWLKKAFEHIQGGWLHSLCGKSVSMFSQPDLSHLFSQWKVFPDVQMEHLVLQWESIVSGPLSGHHQKLCCLST